MYNMNYLNIVILAGGKGKRTGSTYPKVLHNIAGKPMIQHIIDTVMKLKNIKNIYIVYGHGGDILKRKLYHNDKLKWILQSQQLGTGNAIQQVASSFHKNENILILYGDVPLISENTLKRLILSKKDNTISMVTVTRSNPAEYGRIIRKNNYVIGVVEAADANEIQKNIKEVNTGILIINSNNLKYLLKKISNNNSQNEFYITEIINIAYKENIKIITIYPESIEEVEGINNFLQLSKLERFYQIKQAEKLLLSGVRLIDPKRFDLRGELSYGNDIIIDANVFMEGKLIIGNNVVIGVGCILKNCIIGSNSIINPYSIIENSELLEGCKIGPFARIRPNTKISKRVKIGNFVEIKKSTLGDDCKIGHLTYIGDTEIGNMVNIGAGTITCNYDGTNKLKTKIEDNVFIGSDTQLIAPIKISKGATIGAGSTITKNVEENELAISRIKQKNIKNWKKI